MFGFVFLLELSLAAPRLQKELEELFPPDHLVPHIVLHFPPKTTQVKFDSSHFVVGSSYL